MARPDNQRNHTRPAIFCLLCTIPIAADAHLLSLSGSLSSTDGVSTLDSWGTGLSQLSWTIDHCENCLDTVYSYNLEHAGTDTFEFILEVHPNMVNNPAGVEAYGISSTLPNHELGFFSPGTSRPGMPETIAGLRFWGNTGSTQETISFQSDYLPMWGDFYAASVDGQSAAWNVGFTASDLDPSSITTNGSADFHLLVPGKGGIGIVPVPPALWLFGSGLVALLGSTLGRPSRRS